jgi:5-formyltetrahydrofolate cyclo-ligase
LPDFLPPRCRAEPDGGDTQAAKREIRARMKLLLKEADSARRADGGTKAAEFIRAQAWYQKAAVVFSFASLPDEADTSRINRNVLRDGKRLALPRITGGLRGGGEPAMEFALVDSPTRLVPNERGIAEPPADSPATEPRALADDGGILVIVPGCAFTKDGRRLGRGGGFYDRYLARLKTECARAAREVTLAGYCFDFQVIDDIPAEPHDVRMDFVIAPPPELLRLFRRGDGRRRGTNSPKIPENGLKN